MTFVKNHSLDKSAGPFAFSWALLGLCLLAFTGKADAQVPEFRAQSGLLSDAGLPSPPFRSGTPMGVVDLNGDGRDDIVRVGAGTADIPDQLSLEFQATPGASFEHCFLGQIAEEWAVSLCVADVDGDGVNDFLLGGYDISGGNDEGSLVLYRGDIDGTMWTPDPAPVRDGDLVVQGTIFTDIDNDGHIDVFACDDFGNPEKFYNDGTGSLLWDTSDAVFPTGITWTSGFNPNEGNYSVIATDIDNDGDIDYYLSKCRAGDGVVTSQRRINRLFLNDGSSNYTEATGAAGLDDPNQSWCANFGDIDNDGDLDCFVLNHPFVPAHPSGPSDGSILYLNDGAGNFSDSTAWAGLAGELDLFGIQSLFRDFDNDGYLDLLVTSIVRNPPVYKYFQNDGDGTFTAYGPGDGVFRKADGTPLTRLHSVAVGDLNHDGFLDVYAALADGINNPSPVVNDADLLFFNLAPAMGNTNHFLGVTLAGSQSNPNGIGARIEVHGTWDASAAPGMQLREMAGGEGYGIMNSLNTHFGLGSATEVDQLVVRWPSGVVDAVDDVPGGRYVTVFEGTAFAAMDFADWIGDFYPAGGSNADAYEDPDGDKLKNCLEQLLGFDPTKRDAVDRLEVFVVENGGTRYLVVAVDRVPTRNVVPEFEFTDDLSGPGSWAVHPAAEVLEDSPTRYSIRLPVNAFPGDQVHARLVAKVEGG